MDSHDQHDELYKMRHSAAHLLAAAVQQLWPEVKLGVGPVIDNGFYYDFDLKHRITEEDLPKIEAMMKIIADKDFGYDREDLSIAEAKKRAKEMKQPFKVELIEQIEKTGSTAVADAEAEQATELPAVDTVTFYTTGEFVDLCRGGHVETTKEIGPYKLLSIAGAYWRGDEKNPMMQRIYGTCWPTQAELNSHLKQLEEARQRDHRRLGKELDLFVFSDLVGSGLPLFTPRGTLIRQLLDEFVWKLRRERGYERVEIPHITKKELYETSGHWEKFKDDLFKVETRDGHTFAMKPMNCPHHTQIYNRRSWSYRDLPQRYANTTMVYRDEQTGELAGLTRVRSITQDDAHVFCRYSQVKAEAAAIWDIIDTFYGAFAFDLSARLSFHDPKHPEKYLGSEEMWQQAEDELRSIAKDRGVQAAEVQGEAAFYGPKIDLIAKDSIGREWQVATIQLDVNMPERFDLSCKNEEGTEERIVMIHAAIMGSIERFFGVLIEHYAGKFPLWLSPVQVKVLPIADRHNDYAAGVVALLKAGGYRVELDDRKESVGKKIRAGQTERVPYLLIVGDAEIESGTVAIRSREQGDEGTASVEMLLKRMHDEPNPLR